MRSRGGLSGGCMSSGFGGVVNMLGFLSTSSMSACIIVNHGHGGNGQKEAYCCIMHCKEWRWKGIR